MTRPFAPGDRALLFDAKGRRYLVTLVEGGEFHTHAGPIPHAQLLGQHEGCGHCCVGSKWDSADGSGRT